MSGAAASQLVDASSGDADVADKLSVSLCRLECKVTSIYIFEISLRLLYVVLLNVILLSKRYLIALLCKFQKLI